MTVSVVRLQDWLRLQFVRVEVRGASVHLTVIFVIYSADVIVELWVCVTHEVEFCAFVILSTTIRESFDLTLVILVFWIAISSTYQLGVGQGGLCSPGSTSRGSLVHPSHHRWRSDRVRGLNSPHVEIGCCIGIARSPSDHLSTGGNRHWGINSLDFKISIERINRPSSHLAYSIGVLSLYFCERHPRFKHVDYMGSAFLRALFLLYRYLICSSDWLFLILYVVGFISCLSRYLRLHI